LWVLKVAVFTAERASRKVMALDLCNCTTINRFDHRIARSHQIFKKQILYLSGRASFEPGIEPRPRFDSGGWARICQDSLGPGLPGRSPNVRCLSQFPSAKPKTGDPPDCHLRTPPICSGHVQGRHVEFENGFHFLALGMVLLSDPDDLPHSPHIEPTPFHFGIDVTNIV
jgi:hypothetical protein